MVFFDTKTSENGRMELLIVGSQWWLFPVITIPLTILVFVIWVRWQKYHNRMDWGPASWRILLRLGNCRVSLLDENESDAIDDRECTWALISRFPPWTILVRCMNYGIYPVDAIFEERLQLKWYWRCRNLSCIFINYTVARPRGPFFKIIIIYNIIMEIDISLWRNTFMGWLGLSGFNTWTYNWSVHSSRSFKKQPSNSKHLILTLMAQAPSIPGFVGRGDPP